MMTTVIPPAHCITALHIRRLPSMASTSVSMVAPVVVNALTDSKSELAKENPDR